VGRNTAAAGLGDYPAAERKTVTAGDINYAAACCPLNAARRSLKPRDSSFGVMVFAIFVVTRADVHYARAFPPTPIELSPRLSR
jgi:hypothetical protein